MNTVIYFRNLSRMIISASSCKHLQPSVLKPRSQCIDNIVNKLRLADRPLVTNPGCVTQTLVREETSHSWPGLCLRTCEGLWRLESGSTILKGKKQFLRRCAAIHEGTCGSRKSRARKS